MDMIEKIKPQKQLNAISVAIGNRIVLIKLEDIIFFQSEDKYTSIHDINDKKYIIDHSLSTLEKKLAENFIRVHRSFIINYNFINDIRKGFNGKLIFEMKDKNKTTVTTGSSYSSHVKTY